MASYTPQYTDSYSSDPFSGLFQPDVMLPSQFNGDGEGGIGGGERRLMAALLSDGVEAYIGKVLSQREADPRSSDIREWVETKDATYVFSFDNVCSCLGIDPDYLRLGLARYVRAIKEKRTTGQRVDVVWRKIRRPRK